MKRPPRRKPRAGASSGKPGFGRRTPPPDKTGLEAAYLGAQVEAGDVVVVELRGGATVQGKLVGFDRDVITVRADDGPVQVLRKSAIRYVREGSQR